MVRPPEVTSEPPFIETETAMVPLVVPPAAATTRDNQPLFAATTLAATGVVATERVEQLKRDSLAMGRAFIFALVKVKSFHC
jgi:hypothetical protein